MTKHMQPQDFMKRAVELSREKMREGFGGPFGAVIVKDGKVVAEGWNQVTSHNDPTAHAEVVAIRRAADALRNFNLEGCEIYTSCEPCPMCLAAIYWARISKVYYAATRQDAANIGFDDALIYDEIMLDITSRQLSMEQLLPDPAVRVMKEWEKKPDKIPY